jgi:hypothetical protein
MTRPSVWLVGEVEHPDFAESVALVRDAADIGPRPPELIVVAQSRPGAFPSPAIERLRRSAPLAGVVALVGSWCEGETRSGRPAAGVARLYWYEFPSWWRRQLALRAAGRCPEWARPEDFGLRAADCRLEIADARIAIETTCWETTSAIEDVLQSAGAEAVWVRPGHNVDLSGVTAGIWEGGQLKDSETERLSAFCAKLAPHQAPVLALLDFPRRDRCEAARRAGAMAVMGTPWLNVDLVATLRQIKLMTTRASHAA